MWVNLQRFGAVAAWRQVDETLNYNKNRELVIRFSAATDLNEGVLGRLLDDGFILNGETELVRKSGAAFTLGEMKKWFDGLNAGDIDEKATPDYLPKLTSAPVMPSVEPILTIEAHAAVTLDQPLIKPKRQTRKKPEKIVDVGVKIGGARKDFAKNALSVDDLQNANNAELHKIVLRDNIWAYDAKQALADGASPGVILWMRDFRRNIPDVSLADGTMSLAGEGATVDEENKLRAELYIRFIEKLRNAFGGVKSKQDIGVAVQKLSTDADFEQITRSGLFRGNGLDWRVARAAMRRMETAIRMASSIHSYLIDRDGSVTPKGWDHTNDYFDENVDYATKKLFPAKKTKVATDEPVVPDRPHLDFLADDFLDGKDHAPEELVSRFGFRAVEFGNWLPNDERQRVVNHAVAAFTALSQVMGLDEKAISLNGSLAVAFGSRGVGKFAAHYEPARKVKNMTRLRGAGSLCHEWAHALDNWLGEQMNGNTLAYATDNPHIEFGYGTDAGRNAITSILKEVRVGMQEWVKAATQKYDPEVAVLAQEKEINKRLDWGMSWLADLVSDDLRQKATTRMKAVNPAASWQEIAESHPSGNQVRKVAAEIATEVLKQHLANSVSFKGFSDQSSFSSLSVENTAEFTDNPHFNPNFHAAKTAVNDIDKVVAKETLVRLKEVYPDFTGVSASDIDAGHKKGSSKLKKNIHNCMLNLSSMENALLILLSAKAGVKDLPAAHVDTDFLAHAKVLDKKKAKPYWATHIELFARNFEQYVFYKLEDLGKKSEYLVHSVQENLYADKQYAANPYPFGRDRTATNKQMDKLVGIIQSLPFFDSNNPSESLTIAAPAL